MHLWHQNSNSTDIQPRSREKSYQERPLRFFKWPTIPRDEAPESELKLSEVVEPSDESYGAGHQRHHKRHKSGALPLFQRHPEATPSELFYDLFFVANLSTFTENNEVIVKEGLEDYIGFFCIIWFTWFQVALFDVRFSRDSVFDRMCKIAQFGVQVGFSFIAARFDPVNANDKGLEDGKGLSLLLMASRLILMGQYISLWVCLRRWRDKSLMVGLMVGTCFIVAAIFLGISFKFGQGADQTNNGATCITWYLVSVVEAVVHITIACTERYFSFKGTHLVERMSLMTLIVLGEGILGLSSSITKVWDHTRFYPGLGAAVISVILLIYAIYMLYFDTLAQEHFGTIRQQIWAVLHFPLHMALVLFDEGTKQFVIFNAADTKAGEFFSLFGTIPLVQQALDGQDFQITEAQNTTEYFESQADAMMDAFYNFLNLPTVAFQDSDFELSKLNETVETVRNGVSTGPPEVAAAIGEFLLTVIEDIKKAFQIETKEGAATDIGHNIASLFNLVFVYFYGSIGIALLIMLALWVISKRSNHTWFDFVRFTMWAVVGLGIGLLALLRLSSNDNGTGASDLFIGSNWVLPTPMIALIALTVVYHLPFGHNA